MTVFFKDESQQKATSDAINDDVIQKLSQAKGQIFSVFGQVVFGLSSVPRYRSQSLADLGHLVIDPISHDRIVIVSKKMEDGAEQAVLAPNAIAIWASVSADVDAKIVEQIKAGVFPVRLKPADWNSGEIVWLLDVIAPTRELATSVLSNFNTIAKQNQIKVHPIIGRLVDSDVLRSLIATPDDKNTLPADQPVN
ncbi:toxin-activating lysine-acyltransferase [Agrobacterium sp. S2/73]|uniref:toxin-activating lysine-acyltransferase n=1 Tax=Agrobacterium TaxID=357 RepID=UPI0015736C72|nr:MULTISPECIES: toxin-activating lysine-acyltransferase [unclassified Agrobacterium]MBO9112084.1 toxin-activating lysine-acyltransferase [Agrobacterium sp. S2/73]NTA13409.1 toxin-activating lysine-acyltransferase [Agrobacterium tumefaciens]QXZ76431.1 toxin-activating lysine-acyltransferase [Agrobacterium sp. S7/73]